jgi:hypothetical protein
LQEAKGKHGVGKRKSFSLRCGRHYLGTLALWTAQRVNIVEEKLHFVRLTWGSGRSAGKMERKGGRSCCCLRGSLFGAESFIMAFAMSNCGGVRLMYI